MRVLSIAVGVMLALSVPASADMTRERWEGMRERFTKVAKRHENISHCTKVFLDGLTEDLVREIEDLTKSQGREAMADFCAALIEDIVSGEVTYDDIFGEAE